MSFKLSGTSFKYLGMNNTGSSHSLREEDFTALTTKRKQISRNGTTCHFPLQAEYNMY